MTRQNAIKLIKEAGYHGELEKFRIVMMQTHINYKKAEDFYRMGEISRERGQRCSCDRCTA